MPDDIGSDPTEPNPAAVPADAGAPAPADAAPSSEEEDIDLAVIEVPEERGKPARPEPDPRVAVPGMVALYNPAFMPLETGYGGRPFPVRPGGVDLVSEAAADMAVGPSNAGGKLSYLGVRRLYAVEDRWATVAAEAGLSVEEWVSRENGRIRAIADAIWEDAKGRVEGELEGLERSRAIDAGE